MSGRIEQDMLIEEQINKKLQNSPVLIQDYMLSIYKKKTPSTRQAYLRYLIQYANFMEEQNINLLDVKPMHIDRFIGDISKTNGPCIINAKISAIINFYKYLEKNELIKKNPCSTDIKMKIDEKETVTYLTEEEIEEVKRNIRVGNNRRNNMYNSRDLCIVTLGCATGLRVSALANIDINDINFDEKTISVVEKGNKKRIIYIGNNTIDAIQSWMCVRKAILNGVQEDALFISQRTHKRISTDAISNMLKNATKTLDKHITPHKMRSTCAMKLYDKTGDIYLTAQQLGHANIKNTMIYAKATENKLRQAAEILD